MYYIYEYLVFWADPAGNYSTKQAVKLSRASITINMLSGTRIYPNLSEPAIRNTITERRITGIRQ